MTVEINTLQDLLTENDGTISVAIDLAALCRHMANQEILIRELRIEIANLHFRQAQGEEDDHSAND